MKTTTQKVFKLSKWLDDTISIKSTVNRKYAAKRTK